MSDLNLRLRSMESFILRPFIYIYIYRLKSWEKRMDSESIIKSTGDKLAAFTLITFDPSCHLEHA